MTATDKPHLTTRTNTLLKGWALTATLAACILALIILLGPGKGWLFLILGLAGIAWACYAAIRQRAGEYDLARAHRDVTNTLAERFGIHVETQGIRSVELIPGRLAYIYYKVSWTGAHGNRITSRTALGVVIDERTHAIRGILTLDPLEASRFFERQNAWQLLARGVITEDILIERLKEHARAQGLDYEVPA